MPVSTEPPQPKSEQPVIYPEQPTETENKEPETPKIVPRLNQEDKDQSANEVKPAEETNYYEPTQKVPQDNTSPHLVLLTPPEETAIFEAVRGEDGSLIVNTKDVPKNEWTNIANQPQERSCPSGFEPSRLGQCVGKIIIGIFIIISNIHERIIS